MLYNYFKIACRNLLKNKVYSFVNIGGMGVGLAACLAIGMYIQEEYSYDRFHPNFNHLYRIVETQQQADGTHPVALTPGPLAPVLQKDFAEILHTTRMGRWPATLQMDSIRVETKETLIAENAFFTMFGFKLVLGDPKTVLSNPDEIVLTEALAEQIFGSEWRKLGVLGKVLMLTAEMHLTIVGVVENPPVQSSIQFDALLPFKYLEKIDEWTGKWNSNSYHTYVQLRPEADVAGFGQKISNYLVKYDANNEATLQLQALSEIYLHSKFDFESDWGKRGDYFYVKIFFAVGLILLLIAMVNFINLATARSVQRAREVGIRKSVGAYRSSLVVQFLGESLLMTTLAVGVALLLAPPALSLFNVIAERKLVLPFNDPNFWLIVAAATGLIGLITGAYPAFYLSAFRPARVLKGMFDTKSGLGFRKPLVVGQFVLSVALGIGTVVIYHQLNFIQYKKLGFDQSQLLFVRLKGETRDKSAILKAEISKLPGVAAVTATTSNLVNVANTSTLEWEGQVPNDEFLITQMNVDADFMQTTGMEIVAGRNFSAQTREDTTDRFGRYLINETAAKRMGYTNESALGKKVKFWGLNGEVIGVLKDFHFRSLSVPIESAIFRYRPKEFYFNLLVKMEPNSIPATIEAITQVYQQVDANNPITFGFVNEELDAQYRAEQRIASTVLYFSILAIFISCLGLFGLAAFTAEQRTKEIGIRKVLGASIAGITGLLAKDFLKLVLIAIVIASPIAYYFMQRWLADFAYHIDIQWWMFALAGLVALLIAFLTVGGQAVKAALANPVKSLRSE